MYVHFCIELSTLQWFCCFELIVRYPVALPITHIIMVSTPFLLLCFPSFPSLPFPKKFPFPINPIRSLVSCYSPFPSSHLLLYLPRGSSKKSPFPFFPIRPLLNSLNTFGHLVILPYVILHSSYIFQLPLTLVDYCFIFISLQREHLQESSCIFIQTVHP